MIDCTKTTNYFSEKKRMGRQASGVCKLRCTDCPMGMRNNGIGVTCPDFESSSLNKQSKLFRGGAMRIRKRHFLRSS